MAAKTTHTNTYILLNVKFIEYALVNSNKMPKGKILHTLNRQYCGNPSLVEIEKSRTLAGVCKNHLTKGARNLTAQQKKHHFKLNKPHYR